jgi:SAM-dependent methyltransferase
LRTNAATDRRVPSTAQAAWLEQLGGADAYNRWIFDTIRPFVAGRTLEVGCGTGTFSRLLAGAAAHLTAVDIEAPFVAATERATAGCANTTVICADAALHPWPQSFDTIVALEVIEHIADDAGFLRTLGGALAPGGRLVLKVPALPALFGALDRAVGHHRRYDRRGLGARLAAAGLAVGPIAYFNVAGVLGWWLNGRVLGRTRPPGAQVRAFDAAVPLLRRIERLVPPPIGLSLFAVATRPVPQ